MASLNAIINEDTYVFCTRASFIISNIESLAVFREKESITHIIKKKDALKSGIEYDREWSWISLGYESSLSMVGLTATIATALTTNGIPCNIVAAFYHDHIFVPVEKSNLALEIINKITI